MLFVLVKLLNKEVLNCPNNLIYITTELCKTNKVTILHHLEKDTTPLSHPPHNHAAIIDGMTALQKAKANGLTF